MKFLRKGRIYMSQKVNNNFHKEITKVKITYHRKDKDYVAEVLGNSKYIIKKQQIVHCRFIPWKYTVTIEVEKDKYSRENLALILSRLDYACQKGKKVEYIK